MLDAPAVKYSIDLGGTLLTRQNYRHFFMVALCALANYCLRPSTTALWMGPSCQDRTMAKFFLGALCAQLDGSYFIGTVSAAWIWMGLPASLTVSKALAGNFPHSEGCSRQV